MPVNNDSPSFKVRRVDHWPDEFLVGIAGLTWEEAGAYRAICDLIYSSGRNIFSDDPRLVIFGGQHRNRVNAMISRLESLGKITTITVETAEKLQGNRKEISVTRCTNELESARNRVETASDARNINGLNGHARGYTRPHARDSNLQPSTSNLQPSTHARHAREESDSINGNWKKAETAIARQHLLNHGPGCQCSTCDACPCEECEAKREARREHHRQKLAQMAGQPDGSQQERQPEATPDRP